jgi:uncharacterized protein YjbI with pentapeptide repeats
VTADLREANLDNADLEGANLEGAILAGANFSRANLEGANLVGADLTGAKFSYAQLHSANLSGADLSGAVLANADLVECYLGSAKLLLADLSNANLRSANCEDADFTDARLNSTDLSHANMRRAKLCGASLLKANFSHTALNDADLSQADARNANLTAANLEGANLTGAKLGGITGTGKPVRAVKGDSIDASLAGDGSAKIPASQILEYLSEGPKTTAAPPPVALSAVGPRSGVAKRYFGQGDTLRNATLEFEEGASVEIESLFEQCSITLGKGTELVVGKAGILAGCKITGFGKITINGHFFEREAPGIVGPRELVVTSGGCLVGAVEQAPDDGTRFGFEPGCKLRMKISKRGPQAAKGGKV